jgi:chromosome condensin MukBEF ATPase and DNA-binding subunit MukB
MRSNRIKEIEMELISRGFPPNIQVAKKMIVRKKFFMSNPNVMPSADQAYQLPFSEFASLMGEMALNCTKYKSVKAANSMLRAWYEQEIVAAMNADKESVSIDGLEMFRFRRDYMKLIKDYCRRHNIFLD